MNERVAGVGGGGGGTCYNCGEAGHMVCPFLLPFGGDSADDSRETVPRPLSQAPSEVNATTVEREDIR